MTFIQLKKYNMTPFFKSKTIYLGVLVALIPVLQAVQAIPMSPAVAGALSSVLGVLVVINRFYTSTAIGNTPSENNN
jgi:hypothetical protein